MAMLSCSQEAEAIACIAADDALIQVMHDSCEQLRSTFQPCAVICVISLTYMNLI